MSIKKIIINKMELLNLLYGRPTHTFGCVSFWKCPFCSRDLSENNLSYNHRLDILWCFSSNGLHSAKILKSVLPKMPECKFGYQTRKYIKQKNKRLSDNFQLYLYYKMYSYHRELMEREDCITNLHEQRGFTKDTIKD